MLEILLNFVALTITILICEYLWRAKKISSETSRKFMHIFGGVLAAFWPLYLAWQEVQLMVILSVIAIALLRWGGLAKSFFDVKRKTFGDILGPLTIGLLAFLSPPPVIFVLVVLHVALADSMAAIIGMHFGKSTSYKVFGYNKSLAGTFACLIVSFIIVLSVYLIGQFGATVTLLSLLVIPISVALVENISMFGIDNTLIAVTVGTLAMSFGYF